MRRSDLAGLRPGFRHLIEQLEHRMRAEKIHMRRWETLRTYSRQRQLLERGASNAPAGRSPHNLGLAVDYVLDTRRVHVAMKPWKNTTVPFAWDRSTEHARQTWRRFGALAESLGLVWGGRWSWPNGQDTDEHGLGWDLPHVEAPDWRRWVGR